jgi:hypothetical protein
MDDVQQLVVKAQLDNLRKRVVRLEAELADRTVERDTLHAECEGLKNQLRLLQLRGAEVEPKQVVVP